MKPSARNVLPGTAVEIVTAAITNDAAAGLGLKVGGKASAVIKASDVMIGTDD